LDEGPIDYGVARRKNRAQIEKGASPERRASMRRIIASLVTCVSLLFLVGGPAGGQDKKPDATLELSGGRVAAGIGFSWGSGTLTYQGKKYPVKVEGLSIGEVGITRATARGDVFDLKNLDDFSGNYNAAEVGATLAAGASATAMKNQNGVVILLTSTTQGANLKLAATGAKLTLQK
jgi:hypothetical protein